MMAVPGAQLTSTQVIRINAEIAGRLEEVSEMLAEQHANRYRVNAYRRAAASIREWPTSVAELARVRGVDGLDRIPGIGERLAQAVYQLVMTGRLPMLERLRGECDPVELFSGIFGIGEITARRIHEELGISTLQELEIAAHDGRLQGLGMGPKRLAGIRDALAGRLGRIGRSGAIEGAPLPPVAEILDVDREYRDGAAKDSLPKIAPHRLNPAHEAWLPVLHTRRDDWQFTVLFSNTQLAHQLGKTRDWVVIYFQTDTEVEGQCTVVTESRGPLRGRRGVRGRERDCEVSYASGSAIA